MQSISTKELPGTIYSVADEVEKLGVKALPLKLDVRNDSDMENVVDQTIKQSEEFSNQGLSELDEATELLKKVAPVVVSSDVFFIGDTKTEYENDFWIIKNLKQIVNPPISGEAIEIYKKLYPALVRNKMFYDSIINGQNMLKDAVIEYNDYITNPEYALYSSMYKKLNEKNLAEFRAKINRGYLKLQTAQNALFDKNETLIVL